MSALSKILPTMVLLAMASAVHAQPRDVVDNKANFAAEKKASSYAELVTLRRDVLRLGDWKNNPPIKTGEISGYLQDVGVRPYREERFTLVQFLYLNGVDLFPGDGGDVVYAGTAQQNHKLSLWLNLNKSLFVEGNITKQALQKAKKLP